MRQVQRFHQRLQTRGADTIEAKAYRRLLDGALVDLGLWSREERIELPDT